MKKKLSKSWIQFFEELKDGRRMSNYDYKIIRKSLDYMPYIDNPIDEDLMLRYVKEQIKVLVTDKELNFILKRNPELLELFI